MGGGLVAVTAAVTAAVVVVTQLPGGTAHPGGAVAARHAVSATTLRARLLAAFDAAGGQILYDHLTVQSSDGDGFSSQEWYSPWGAQPGQQVRYRALIRNANGTLSKDIESIGALPVAGSPPPGYVYPTAEFIDVEYGNRTWSDQEGMPSVAGSPWDAAVLRAELSAGYWTVRGPVEVNGHQAIELSRRIPGGPDGIVATTRIWVDATTYLPLRAESSDVSPGHTNIGRFDFTLLPATAANLAQLRPVIPAGFRKTAKVEKSK
jgi:hypothetical protein